ncbi:MAG TPA: glycosyltransferase family A protein [Gemmatimonadales bacterium]
MTNLTVTIAVPTRNRAPALRQCLTKLTELEYSPFDILVVDNGSTDDTATVVRSFAADSPVPVRYLFESRRGLCHARNRALAEAGADVVGFVDDDCYPQADWLSRIMVEFADERVGYVGGRLLLHDPTDAPYTVNTSTTRIVRPAGEWHSGDDLPGTGMAVRRRAFRATGGYDPLLGPGGPLLSGDDIDMHWRLWAAGWTGVYTPDAVTYHAHGRKPESDSLVNIKYDYAIARGGWYAKRFLFGPRRFRTLYAWVIWERPRHSVGTLATQVRGLFRYLRLALPRLARGGISALHPPIFPSPTSGSSS